MNLHDYLSQERGRQAALAKAIGAHPPDVSRWADGSRPIPVAYGAQIEAATGGEVTRREMFPNDWQTIWPELAGQCSTDHARRQPIDAKRMMSASIDQPSLYEVQK